MRKKLSGLFLFCLFALMALCIPVSAHAAEKGYSIGTGNTRVYSDTGLSSGKGWIYPSDEVTINQISGSYLKVTYPIKNGTKWGYVSPGTFLTKTGGWQTYTSRAKITTYKRPGGATYGYIAKGDSVNILGTSGNYTQVRYPVSGGYKYAFISTNEYNSSIKPSTPKGGTAGCQDMANGWYMVISGNADDRVLDINDWNQNNGGNLEIYARNNTTNQRFYLQYLGNGFYSIKAYHSGRYLHVADGNNPQANVHQWEGGSHVNAQWSLKAAGNGYYYLQNRASGSYLDNANGSTSLANNVITWPYNGGNAQKWRFVSTNTTTGEKRSVSDGWYMIESGNSASRVLDINNFSQNDGGNLETYQKNNTNNQRFYLQYMGNGYYSVKAGHSGKYLHAAGAAGTPDNVHQWGGNGHNNALWCLESAGGGYYYLRCRSGNYLDNANGSTANGNNVITYYFNGSNAQKWKFVSTSAPSAAVTYTTYYVTARTGLILRRGPGTNYDKILTMPTGATVQVASISNGWARAKYDGKEGYCSSEYLSKSNPNDSTNLLVSQAEISSAASRYGIGTNSNAYQALLSINSKYYSRLSGNKGGTNIFLFEGVGNNDSAGARMNAMCVVVKAGRIVYINRNSSTIPDYPFTPSKNGGTAMPTIRDGVYGFTTVNHKGNYAALNVTNANVVRFNSKSSYYNSTSSAINVHQRSTDSIAPSGKSWVNSAGCQLVGKKSEYLSFIKAVGIVSGNSVTTYSSRVSGRIVIDRTYATTYLLNVGYPSNAISAIRG